MMKNRKERKWKKAERNDFGMKTSKKKEKIKQIVTVKTWEYFTKVASKL